MTRRQVEHWESETRDYAAGFAARHRSIAEGVQVQLWMRQYPGLMVEVVLDEESTVGFAVKADHRSAEDLLGDLLEVEFESLGLPESDAPPPGWRPKSLTARALRKVKLAEVERTARHAITRSRDFHVRLVDQVQDEPTSDYGLARRTAFSARAEKLEAFTTQARPGRAGFSDHHYAVIAAACVDALERGETIKSLAASEGWSPQRFYNSLNEARRRGLLAPTIQGRAGGSLTERGRQVLAEGG